MAFPEPLAAKNKESFAYVTVKDRLPTILVKAMDYFRRSAQNAVNKRLITQSKEERLRMEDECKAIIALYSKLRYEMMTNKEMEPFNGNFSDLNIWNEELTNLKRKQEKVTWFDSPWLFVECFMYRKFANFYQTSVYFKDFDPFEEQKTESLIKSVKAVEAVAEHLYNSETKLFDAISTKEEFLTFLYLSLWGNKCDLSMFSECSEDNSDVQGFRKLHSFIVCDESDYLYDFVSQLKSVEKNVVIDVILDNAGYELFTDLCFVEMLYLTGLLSRNSSMIRFYVKKLPWFVSDTLKKDFYYLLDFMSNHKESKYLQKLSEQWKEYLREKTWTIVEDDYWTLPNDYSDMQRISPQLYQKLQESELLLFKGDLNYRKLVGDLQWDPRESLKRALRDFLPSNLCTLRTVKADVVVGLNNDSVYSSLPSNWMITGEFAVIQFVRKD